MNWAFLLHSPDICGGNIVIFEHAVRAVRSGLSVSIITKEPVDISRIAWHPEAGSLSWQTFAGAAAQTFDVAFATYWETAYDLHLINAVNYAYFVQSIESRFFSEEYPALRKLVDSTYMLPLQMITEATWIKKHLAKEYGVDAYLVRNGIRKDLYSETGYRHAERERGKLRVLVEGPLDIPYKNVVKTIDLCLKSDADEIWLLTVSKVDAYPGVTKVFSNVPITDTPAIYRSCDVLVKLSYVEGMFGPPLEMFHCGGTAITYNVTGHDEYIVHDLNALVADKDDDATVLSFINRLKSDSTLLERLKDGAIKSAAAWPGWDDSALLFRNAVQELSKKKPVTQEALEKKTKFFSDFFDLAEKQRLKYLKNPLVVLINRLYEKLLILSRKL